MLKRPLILLDITLGFNEVAEGDLGERVQRSEPLNSCYILATTKWELLGAKRRRVISQGIIEKFITFFCFSLSMSKKKCDSALEVLTSEVPSILWQPNYDELLERIRNEILGVNHADWKTPRRGFHFDGTLYWINVPEKRLYQQPERNNVLIREFDKVSHSGHYIFEGNPQEVLQEFLNVGYDLVKDNGIRSRSG